MEPTRIPKVVLGLTLFWGFMGTIFFPDKGFYWPAGVLAVVGFLFAAQIAEMRSNEYREDILKKLRYNKKLNLPITDFKAFSSVEKGVVSSLGPVPFQAPLFKSSDNFSVELLYPHYPDALKEKGEPSDFIKNFLLDEKIKEGYKQLFIEICKVFLAEKYLFIPAGFNSRHKNTSLISHSLIVCHMAAMDAKKYKYDVFNFVKKDKLYEIDPNDPLIPIIGMAHDIGKLLSFKRDEKGEIQGYTDYHTNMGSRMIVQLPSYWSPDLTNEDRRIIQTIITYYHTPERTPGENIIDKGVTQKNKRVSSDRLHAIMDVLITADSASSFVSKGQTVEQASEAVSSIAAEIERGDIRPLKTMLYQFFASTKFHVNSRKGQRSVAFKYCLPELTQGKNYLFFDSKEFSSAFIEYWKSMVESSSEKDYIESLKEYSSQKTNPCTKIIMGHLLDEGKLVDLFPDGLEISRNDVEKRLYKVVFGDPKTKEEVFSVSPMFVMDIDQVPELSHYAVMNNNHGDPISVSPTNSRNRNGRFGYVDMIEKDAREKLTGEKTEDKSILDLLAKPKVITPEQLRAILETWINPGKANLEIATGITLADYRRDEKLIILLLGKKRLNALVGLDTQSPLELLAPYGISGRITESKHKLGQFVLALHESAFSTQALNFIDLKFPNASI